MTPLRELMAERDIIDELPEGAGKTVIDWEDSDEFLTRRGVRLERARTIFMSSGWVIYKNRVWYSAGAQFTTRYEVVNGLLCELLPRHPEIDTVLVDGNVDISRGGLTCVLSPTIRHVMCPLLYMVPSETQLETLCIEDHSCVPGREAMECCRCQTLTILRLSPRYGVAGLQADIEEWGKERGPRKLVVEKIEKVNDYGRVEEPSDADREEARRIVDTFTPYEEDEDEIVGMKPAATRVPYDDD
jgi:hypothetical protein